MRKPRVRNKYLHVNSTKIYRRISVDLIIYIIVEDYVSKIYFFNDHDGEIRFIEICRSLKEIEMEVNFQLFRINRNCLINLLHIIEIDKKNRKVLMSGGDQLNISSRRFSSLINTLKYLQEDGVSVQP